MDNAEYITLLEGTFVEVINENTDGTKITIKIYSDNTKQNTLYSLSFYAYRFREIFFVWSEDTGTPRKFLNNSGKDFTISGFDQKKENISNVGIEAGAVWISDEFVGNNLLFTLDF